MCSLLPVLSRLTHRTLKCSVIKTKSAFFLWQKAFCASEPTQTSKASHIFGLVLSPMLVGPAPNKTVVTARAPPGRSSIYARRGMTSEPFGYARAEMNVVPEHRTLGVMSVRHANTLRPYRSVPLHGASNSASEGEPMCERGAVWSLPCTKLWPTWKWSLQSN